LRPPVTISARLPAAGIQDQISHMALRRQRRRDPDRSGPGDHRIRRTEREWSV